MKNLYITSVRTYSGKTALSLGLGLRMQAAGLKVGLPEADEHAAL